MLWWNRRRPATNSATCSTRPEPAHALLFTLRLTSTRPLMIRFRLSYLIKLLLFLLGLVLGLETISYIATRLVIQQAVEQNARAELRAGGELFTRLLQNNASQLALSVKVLTEDFGFKDAVASGDANTIRSALANHAGRIKADLGLLVDSDGRLISSDAALEQQAGAELQQLRQRAQERGQAYDTVILQGRAYQLVFFAVRAPQVIGYAGMGFGINSALSDELKRLTGLEVSFIHTSFIHTGAGQVDYLAGTLAKPARKLLREQLAASPAGDEVFVYGDLMSLRVPVLGQQRQLQAVLQVPLSQVMAPFARLNIQLLLLALAFALLAAIAALFLARSVTRPVLHLAAIAQRIAKGFYDTPVAVKSQDELGDLARAFISMQAAISEREQQVIYQAEHDPLTGLPNRQRILPELQRALASLDEDRPQLAALVVDIKNFAQVNDELSQQLGDDLLAEVARQLVKLLPQAAVLRLGSDEFLLLLRLAAGEDSGAYSDKVHALFKRPLLVSGTQLQIGVNLGIALYPQHAGDAESLLRRASLALNQGRAQGISSCSYQAGWDEKHLRRLHISREFESALHGGQLSLYYQPKIKVQHPRQLGAEALVRWRHPQLGFIGPDEFIPVLESSGQITQLTRWVLAVAVAQLQQLLAEGVDMQLSVNLSALDLLADDLPEAIAEHLQDAQLPPARLCLEITESAIMRDGDKSLANLRRLQALGVMLSIDDFGTGYSSLSQLKKLPVSELKIDKSFILNLDASADDQLIVRSTIDLGHTLGLSVTAEGVETPAIRARLQDYGCDTLQGYLYSKPLPATDFLPWVHQYLAGVPL